MDDLYFKFNGIFDKFSELFCEKIIFVIKSKEGLKKIDARINELFDLFKRIFEKINKILHGLKIKFKDLRQYFKLFQ